MTRLIRPALLLLFLLPVVGRAETEVPAVLPADTAVYIELHRPVDLAEYLLGGGVQDLLKETPQLRRYLRSREYAQLRAALSYVETRLGTEWKEALRRATAGGVYLALRVDGPGNPAVAVVLRGDRVETARQVAELIGELANDSGRVREVKEAGISVRLAGNDFGFFTHERDLVLSNNAALLRELVRRYAGAERGPSLATDGIFRAALRLADGALLRTQLGSVTATQAALKPASAAAAQAPKRGGQRLGWLFARAAALRSAEGMSELYAAFGAEKFDDGGVPLLLGGFPQVFSEADYFVFSLWQRPSGLSLVAELPRASSEWPERWQWAYAREPGNEAAVPLRPKGTLLSFSVYRDLKGFWDAKDQLVKREGLAGFIELENELGRLLFPNRDFASEVLGQLDPRIRVVVVEQQLDKEGVSPRIKLPAFAYVQKIKDPDTFGEDLLIAYQSLIGLANLGLAQSNQPRLLVTTGQYRGVTLTVARFRQPADGNAGQAESFLYNFAPTFALCDSYAIIGSNEPVVRQVIDLIKDDPDTEATTPHNVMLELYADPIARLLEQNRDALAHQQVAEQGISIDEARARVDLLIKVVRLFSDARLIWGAGKESMYLRIDVNRK